MRTMVRNRVLVLPVLSLVMAASALAVAGTPASAAVHNGCYQHTVVESGHGVLGNVTGTARTTGRWCVLGIVGNAQYLSSWAETSTPGWSMSGLKGHGAGVVNNSARIWSHYVMTFKTAWVTVQQVTLCPRVYGSAAGVGHASSGCSIY